MKLSRSPRLYRVLVPAKNLNRSRRFYESLLSTRGRAVAGGRIYFDSGPVILGVLDYSTEAGSKIPALAEALYFATADLDGVFLRARALRCLTPGLLHDDPSSPLGQIVVRPWGERSFYAQDPSGNALCFVDDKTLFTGTPRQVAALRQSSKAPPDPETQPPGAAQRARPGRRER
jgi:catechol 2,3-dioxygenase-like lactoylglutathione lyase family enzyme